MAREANESRIFRRHAGHLESAAVFIVTDPIHQSGREIRVPQERFATAGIDDHSRTFNTELTALSSCRGCLTLHWRSLESTAEKNPVAHTSEPTFRTGRRAFLAHTLVHRESDGTLRSATFRSLSSHTKNMEVRMMDRIVMRSPGIGPRSNRP